MFELTLIDMLFLMGLTLYNSADSGGSVGFSLILVVLAFTLKIFT